MKGLSGYPDKETRDQANEKILSNQDLSVKFSMKTPKKMLPKITLTGINQAMLADRREHNRNVLKADITKRNQFLQPLIDNGQTFDVVVIKEEVHSYTVIIKVSPEKNANNHNSVHSKCPTIERECKKLAENTFTIQKNY